MDKVAKHLFIFVGDGVVRDFQGTFSEYLEYRRDQAKPTVSHNVRRWRSKTNRAFSLSLLILLEEMSWLLQGRCGNEDNEHVFIHFYPFVVVSIFIHNFIQNSK